MAATETQTLTSACPSNFGPAQDAELTCCKTIIADFTLQFPGEAPRKVGDLKGYIVDKRIRGSSSKKKRWVQALLNWKRIGLENSSGLSTLYNARGVYRPRYKAYAKKLKTKRIVWIDRFMMYESYRAGGIGRVAFTDFHQVMKQYTSANRTRGAMKLLQPDIIDGGEIKNPPSRADIQFKLMKFYTLQGYQRCHRKDPDKDYTYTLMLR
ncbi:hypothetical protein LTR56_010826 [Elasticomyces elasticus]|nr:hypothetical protein LTR56_010826 [Elasticomyces elasticus]KAK3650300.1 hypothetical protein LTR22_012627 [Elasticomyces elasticus]KAK5768319.1 hypothetical protein LTS12_001458 [Elasticomyces elasticus]